MTVKNPSSETAANQPGLTQEIVDQLESGRMKVEELNETQLRELLAEDDVGGTVPAAPVAQAPVPAATQTPSPEVVKPKAEAPIAPVDGEEYRRKADELNTKNQLLKTKDEELARLRAQVEASKKAKTGAPLPKKTLDDEDFLENVAARLAQLEAENEELRTNSATVLESQVKPLEEDRRKLAVEAIFVDIEAFQYRSKQMGMDLNTKKSIRQLDKEIGAMETAYGKGVVNKLKTDKAFREEQAAKGVVLPDEWDKHDMVMQVHEFKKANGYPTFNSAFADFFASSGLQQRQVAAASLEAANATTEKLIQVSNETALIPADSGGGAASHLVTTEKWDFTKASAWMNAHPEPKTREDVATQHEIMAWLEKQPD